MVYKNIFEAMTVPDTKFEDVDGAFTCQHNDEGCWAVATTARYSEDEQFITWVCPKGHKNFIEGFVL